METTTPNEITIPRTGKPTTVGVLNIITGAVNFLVLIGSIIIIANDKINIIPKDDPFISLFTVHMLIAILILSVICTVLPIVGGIFAFQREGWGWALAGSLISILGLYPLGIVSTILVAMSKDEFL